MTLISRRSALGRALRKGLTDLYLVGPATLVLAVLIFVPVLVVFALSFTDYQLGDRSVTWVGFDQYVTLFTDPIGRRQSWLVEDDNDDNICIEFIVCIVTQGSDCFKNLYCTADIQLALLTTDYECLGDNDCDIL